MYYTELFYSVQRFISERLFKKQKEGDRTDFDAIIEEYGDMVYRIALSHTLDRQYSEDVFQEVFLKLFKNQHKIKDEQHLKHWLIRTTINMSISHNRKVKQTESTIDECADYEDEASFRELKLITEELPEKFRSVILLCWFEGCTAKETAKILHISEGTIKSRLHRARQLLKKVSEE